MALARVAQSAREAIRAAEKEGDAGSVDVLTPISREIDVLHWKVEVHLAPQDPRGCRLLVSHTRWRSLSGLHMM